MTRREIVSWLRQRLTPGEYFGLELTLGALVFVVAAWAFGGLAEVVSVRTLMAAVSWLHTWPATALAVGFLAYLLSRREWGWAIFGSCAVLSGMALNACSPPTQSDTPALRRQEERFSSAQCCSSRSSPSVASTSAFITSAT